MVVILVIIVSSYLATAAIVLAKYRQYKIERANERKLSKEELKTLEKLRQQEAEEYEEELGDDMDDSEYGDF